MSPQYERAMIVLLVICYFGWLAPPSLFMASMAMRTLNKKYWKLVLSISFGTGIFYLSLLSLFVYNFIMYGM